MYTDKHYKFKIFEYIWHILVLLLFVTDNFSRNNNVKIRQTHSMNDYFFTMYKNTLFIHSLTSENDKKFQCFISIKRERRKQICSSL